MDISHINIYYYAFKIDLFPSYDHLIVRCINLQ